MRSGGRTSPDCRECSGEIPAYIQQFVRRGVPKRLKEAERRKLARYFAISEALLGGPAEDERLGRPGAA